MNAKKSLITLGIITSMLFSTNSTFTGHGSGWNVAGPILAVGAVSSIAAASSANSRDREYARYQAEKDREREMAEERRERRREKAAQRRHEKEMALIRAGKQPAGDYSYDEYN